MPEFITASRATHSPVNLWQVGTTHGRRFIAYLEMDDHDAPEGGEVSLDAEAIGGPDDGWLQEVMQHARVPSRRERGSDRFVVIWSLRLPPGERWNLTLRLNGQAVATRTISITEARQ